MNFFKKYFKGDPHIWAIIVGLSVFSLLAVYSSSGTLAYRASGGGNTAVNIIRHAGFLFIGLSATFILHLFPYKLYTRLSLWLVVICVPLLVITLFFGRDINTASRGLPFLGRSFQTSDLAKIALVMYIAQRLAANQGQILDFKKTVLPMLIAVLIICALILPANFSTAALLFLVCVAMLFVGRVSVKHLSMLCAVMLLLGTVTVFGLYGLQQAGVDNKLTQRADTWVNRIVRFKDPETGNADANFQANQAKIAVGTGGFFGKGPGNSVQRNILPHPYSDFIYAIIIEEWGILGGMIVLFLYLNLLYRTVLIVRKCDKTFPAFLAAGMALLVVFQALINMTVAVGLMPVTGQPLPLISMGGTSILFTGVAFGIILGVSREVRKREELQQQEAAGQPVDEPESGQIPQTV